MTITAQENTAVKSNTSVKSNTASRAPNESSKLSRSPSPVTPSISSSGANSGNFTLDQELEPFGKWVGTPIWVPPKDASDEFAKSMLERHGLLSSKEECWSGIIENHRDTFQQVREIDLCRASIRLPKGKLLMSVTEQDRFDEITDTIPNCVQTRLDEFLAGPGKQKGVKVYYLKPLCVEVGDELFFTSHADVQRAIELIQSEVFSAYRRMYLYHRPVRAMQRMINSSLKTPRKMIQRFHQRKQRAIDAYQARLEFNRRKMALRASKVHCRLRTDGGTFDEMLALTDQLERNEVIEQFGVEKKLSQAQRERLKMAALESLPWFVALSFGLSYTASIAASLASIAVIASPPLIVCDPAFVAEMPGSNGVVLKIGHFDEVGGVTHIEI